MTSRDSLLRRVGEEVVKSQDATAAFDDAAAAVLALDRTGLACLSRLLFMGPIQIARLPEELGVTPANARSVVQRLELAGYARRVRHRGARDELILTEHAREWIGNIWGPVQEDGAAALGALTDEQLAFVARFLVQTRELQERHTERLRALMREPGATRATRRTGGLAPAALRRVELYVDSNLDRPLRLAELAERASLTPFHFARAFKRSTGITPHARLLQRRIARARELLETSSLSVGQVALQTGFSSQSHLTTVFRRATGLTPAVVRRNARGAPAGEA